MAQPSLRAQKPEPAPTPGRRSPLIDLHLHTNRSDGVDAPEALVANCAAAGLSVIAVADHDTIDAIDDVAAAARRSGLSFVAGIEITAVRQRKDVHVLGYFVDHHAPALTRFLKAQLVDRIRRARQIGRRLMELGVPIDVESLIASAGGKPVSRPLIAQALVDAGHVENRQSAFERYVGESAPAFEPRAGVSIEDAIGVIQEAGGLSSLAHPGLMGIDGIIPVLARAGLAAIEAYHTDHSEADTGRYVAMARQLGLGLTGGSDYHGDRSHHPLLGGCVLPPHDFDDLCRRTRRRAFGSAS
jgi:predicted metal-dependent phosphoesterase TrpH